MNKQALVDDQSPLPPGYSGSIKLVRRQSRILGDTAILSYDLDETDNCFRAEYEGSLSRNRHLGSPQRAVADPRRADAAVLRRPSAGAIRLEAERRLRGSVPTGSRNDANRVRRRRQFVFPSGQAGRKRC